MKTRKDRMFLKSLLAGVIMTLCYQSQAQEMRVMSYNIRYKNSSDSINGWEFRKENVAGLIRYHQADVVGVQEAQPDQIADLEKLLPGFGWYGVPRVAGKSGEYTAIFYSKKRFKLLDSGTFWFSETPNVKESKSWDAMFPRTASWAKFSDKTSGTEFYFFNTHLDHRGEIARQKSAEILHIQIDAITGNKAVILMGDFNSTPTSIAYKKIMEGGKFMDSQAISETPHYGPVNTSSGFYVQKEPIKSRIDYIFVNKKVKILQHATLADQQEGRYYSDHLPVIAVVEVSR